MKAHFLKAMVARDGTASEMSADHVRGGRRVGSGPASGDKKKPFDLAKGIERRSLKGIAVAGRAFQMIDQKALTN